MKKSTVCLLSLISLLSGVLLGFLLAPTKNGIRIVGTISSAEKTDKDRADSWEDLSFYKEEEE